MKPLSNGLFQTWQRLDGMRFRGFLSTAPVAATKNQVPFRVMNVRNPCPLSPGDTIFGRNGEKMILLEHPSDFDWAKSFKVAYAFRAFDWTRPDVSPDPVTGIERDTGAHVSMGLLYANLDTPTDVTTLGLFEEEYRFITGNRVRVRDKVGDKTVTKVVDVLGGFLVFAK